MALLLGLVLAWWGVNAYASYRAGQQVKAWLAQMEWHYGVGRRAGPGADANEAGRDQAHRNESNALQWQSLRASVLGRLAVSGLQIRLAPKVAGQGNQNALAQGMAITDWQIDRLHIHRWKVSDSAITLHASVQGVSVAGGQSPLAVWEKAWLPADSPATLQDMRPPRWQPVNADVALELDADANHARLEWRMQQPGQQGMALHVRLELANVASLWTYMQANDLLAQWGAGGALPPWQATTLWALLGQARLRHFSVQWDDDGAARRWAGAWRLSRQPEHMPAWLADLQWCGSEGAAWRSWWMADAAHCQSLAGFFQPAEADGSAASSAPQEQNLSPKPARQLRVHAATQAEPALAVLWQAYEYDPHRLPALLGWQVRSDE